jgi:hypothetical protein
MDARALEGIEEIAEQTGLREFGGRHAQPYEGLSMPTQLELASDIDELEQIASQADFHVYSEHGGRRGSRGGRFGWSAAPNIERAKAAHAPIEVAPKESAEPEKPVSIIHIFAGTDVTCYSELIGAIQARVSSLGIRQLDFDKLANFADGLSGKVFGPSQVKRLGPEKMFDALRAASLKIRIEPDPEQLERMRNRIAEHCLPRQANQARPNNHSHPSERTIDQVLSYLASRKGGLRRLKNAVKEARSAIGRRAHAAHLQAIQDKRSGSKYA